MCDDGDGDVDDFKMVGTMGEQGYGGGYSLKHGRLQVVVVLVATTRLPVSFGCQRAGGHLQAGGLEAWGGFAEAFAPGWLGPCAEAFAPDTPGLSHPVWPLSSNPVPRLSLPTHQGFRTRFDPEKPPHTTPTLHSMASPSSPAAPAADGHRAKGFGFRGLGVSGAGVSRF